MLAGPLVIASWSVENVHRRGVAGICAAATGHQEIAVPGPGDTYVGELGNAVGGVFCQDAAQRSPLSSCRESITAELKFASRLPAGVTARTSNACGRAAGVLKRRGEHDQLVRVGLVVGRHRAAVWQRGIAASLTACRWRKPRPTTTSARGWAAGRRWSRRRDSQEPPGNLAVPYAHVRDVVGVAQGRRRITDIDFRIGIVRLQGDSQRLNSDSKNRDCCCTAKEIIDVKLF